MKSNIDPFAYAMVVAYVSILYALYKTMVTAYSFDHPNNSISASVATVIGCVASFYVSYNNE